MMSASALDRPRGPRLRTALGVALAALGCAPPGPAAPAAATASMRHHVRSANGDRLSYLRAGPSHAVPLIFVHGTPGTAVDWADYLANPPPGTEAFALDRPGFGQSGPDAARPRLADQAAAVLAVVPADGRRAVLLGHSLGGPVVARVAADHPERVSALVLVGAALDPALETVHPMQRLGAWGPVKAMLPRVLRNANDELLALKTELDVLASDLPRIAAKVVIVHGTDDDLVPAANVPFVQSRLSGARCVGTLLLQGGNHFLPWNAQADVRRAIAWALEGLC